MASAAGRQHGAAARSFSGGELDDGAAIGRGYSRFWDHVQSVSPRRDPQYSVVWRDAPVHSGAGELVRRQHLRGDDYQPVARVRQEPLRDLADVPGVFRSADDPVPTEIHDAAAALFWNVWFFGCVRGWWHGDMAAAAQTVFGQQRDG